MRADTRAFTVGIPPELYADAAQAAGRKGVSLNRFILEALETNLATLHRRQLTDAFDLLGQDPESDVEFAWAAQHEAVDESP